MKNKFLTFIIGMLVGAIITTIGFYFYTKNIKTDDRENPGRMMDKENLGNKLEKPSDFNGINQGTPPEIPENQNNNTL